MQGQPETYVGKVTRVFRNKSCVGIRLHNNIKRGERYRFLNDDKAKPHRQIDHTQVIDSLEIDHTPCLEVGGRRATCAVKLNLSPGALPLYGTCVFFVPTTS